MEKIMNFAAVGLGGAAGAMLRYGVTLVFAAAGWSGNAATFAVNALGSLLIGYLGGTLGEGSALLLLSVGFCGGFTTFSTFSMQSVRLFQEGRYGTLALYVAGSVTVCIIMAALGWWMSRSAAK